jgi:hypothetical protein
MNPERPSFIACRRDHAGFARSADRDRLAAQFRVIALFDGCVERIRVDMDDLAQDPTRPGNLPGALRSPSKPSPARGPGEDAVRVNRVSRDS